MKILICVEFYDPHVGGAEKHCKLIAEYLNKNNYKVEIATSFLKERKKKIVNGIKINEFNIKGNFIRGYSGEITNYQNFLINSNFDKIVFYAAQQWSFDLSLEIINKINSDLTLIPCGFSKLQNIFYKPYFLLLQSKINKFDKVICLSKDYQDYFFCKKFYKKKTYIIFNGSENNFFMRKGFRKKFKILKDEIMLLYLSNIKFMKGQDRLINIVRKIRNKKKITLIFIHANEVSFPYLVYLKILILIAKLNKSLKVLILKNLNEKDKISAVSECDYFISTSRLECSPLIMFEAMAAGKVYLGTNVGNCMEIQKKIKTGFISNNLNLILKKIEYMIEKKTHTKKKTSYKIYSYFKKNHDWRILLKKYKKLIVQT
jgi:glycosyltransferase involved in cell wall biosynthesis